MKKEIHAKIAIGLIGFFSIIWIIDMAIQRDFTFGTIFGLVSIFFGLPAIFYIYKGKKLGAWLGCIYGLSLVVPILFPTFDKSNFIGIMALCALDAVICLVSLSLIEKLD